MFTLFGTIILVYFLWLVVKPWFARYMHRKFQQKVNDMFRQAYGEQTQGFPFGGEQNNANAQQSYGQQRGHRSKRKIFGRDEGEYVDFEDINVRAEHASAHAKPYSSSTYSPREPQISDAEWEEV